MIGSPGARRIFFATLLLLFSRSGSGDSGIPDSRQFENAADSARLPVRIALIIDDLGNILESGQRAVALDGPVACAVLPHTRHSKLIATQAHAAGKEVLLHLPLQSVELLPLTSSGTIDMDDTRQQLVRIFESDIDSVPHVVGVSNHMGSLLTRHPGHMHWLMDAVKARGNLYFVDSYTTASSVALQLAREHGIPSIRRDVFLDTVPTAEAIDKEFNRLKRLARIKGFAIGIGHPHRETLQYLENTIPALKDEGIELVTVGSLIGQLTIASISE